MSEKEARNFEDYPLNRQEYIAAMVQYYRGEMSRANHWRSRLDTTSNWAVITSMGLLSFAFTGQDHHHASILMGMMIVLHFMLLEARRYRFFDVWRSRVRMIEENFFGPILTRELHSPSNKWASLVAGDLIYPSFKISLAQAMRARLKRNYGPLFVILLLAWMLKMAQASGHSFWESASLGTLHGSYTVVLITGLYGFLFWLIFFVPPVKPAEQSYWEKSKGRAHM